MEWSISPEIFSIGPFTVRWYGLLFATSFIVGFQIMLWIFKKEKKKEKDLNDLVWYMVGGTVIGARLGHCLFYNPSYYLSNPIEILKVWEGGLASHGAAVGILIAVYLYIKGRNDQTYLWVMDRVVITVALAAFFIRVGNFFNSEIIGVPGDVPWAIKFLAAPGLTAQERLMPRHPAQLYEAIAYLITFLTIFFIYKIKDGKVKDGLIFGIFLIMIFGFRIFVERFKEVQSSFEAGMALNMGQILSIPLVILGIVLLFWQPKKVIKIETKK
ncbi:MAG: prolipoprotein diacylglyceryl transferase [Ignavibacteriae bacterium]|nr:prolipoprotein diacylglyceryl transferase [Ignavibacteriota bacterium]NOG99660.1 prolipoprotein diacylglyceryl transferase [Ignavibacteriota bacterium]